MIRRHYSYLLYFIPLFIHHLNGDFAPDANDYDAYGVKIAMNENFLVLAQNNHDPPTFLIQFAPYNNTNILSSKCSIAFPNSSSFIYTVAVGKKQNQSQTQFFFAGEGTKSQSGVFVGVATYNYANIPSNTNPNSSLICNTTFSYSIQPLSTYGHQDYFVLATDPKGALAYGFSNKFIFAFDSQNPTGLSIWDDNATWPNSSFTPHAADMSDTFGVVVGFVQNSVANATAKYIPMIYLININPSTRRPFVVDQNQPAPNPDTWQDLLTNADANVYSAKYDMSVSINSDGNVLVGMQFINRVFYFSVNASNPVVLNYVSRHTNGRSLGNGKSVAWLDGGIAAVLINVYSLSYVWSSSQVFLFDIYQNGYISNSTPLSLFPNNHQLLPARFNPVFLNVASSPSSLALLDASGNIIIFSPTQSGFYASVQDSGSSPCITAPAVCMPGSAKNKVGVHDCILCPTGTKNPGDSNIQCTSCLSESFCPLGSVDDVSQSALKPSFQIVPYPRSPESIIFDEILIRNMFTIGPGRCVIVSPVFWAAIVAAIVLVVIIVMEVLKLCLTGPRSVKIRKIIKYIFRHTDLIGEGEFWIGGLLSFCIVVVVCFAFSFSDKYLKQYPIETTSDSYFACDLTMRNAKFETKLQTLAIPPDEDEKEMFELLNDQSFNVNIDLINTLIKCAAISIQAQYGTTWATLRYLNCTSTDSILTLKIALPYQHITIQIAISDGQTIGALRMGLEGHGVESGSYALRDLEFQTPFSKSGQMLAQNLTVALAITKVINETKPMVGEESEFSGLFIPTFTVDANSLFVTNDQYVRNPLTLTTLTITTSETPYYVKNLEEPITRQSEVVFRNLLFTIVCLEIFGLVFLLYKLVFKPLYCLFMQKCCGKKYRKNSHEEDASSELQPTKPASEHTNGGPNHTKNLSKIDETGPEQVTCAF